MKPYLLLPFAVVLSLSMLGSASAAKLYKWVDKDGNISYQDTPPPNDAKVLQESALTRSSNQATAAQAASSPVVVYTVENCDACEILMVRLRQLDIPFSQESLLNKDIQAEILSVGDSITAPTLKIGSEYIADLSDASVISKLQEAGLNPTLESAAPAPSSPSTSEPSSSSDIPPTNPN